MSKSSNCTLHAGGAASTSLTTNVTIYFANGTIQDSFENTSPYASGKGAQVTTAALSVSVQVTRRGLDWVSMSFTCRMLMIATK